MRTELVLTCPVCQKPLWVINLLITENDVNLVDKQRKAHVCNISTSPRPKMNDDLFGL